MTYRFFCAALFCLFATSIFAQEGGSGFGLVLEPQISGRRLIANAATISQRQIDSIERVEIGAPAYAVGLLWNTRGEKIGFQIGIQYADLGYQTQKLALPADSPRGNQFDRFREQFRQRQVELPLAIHFYQSIGADDDFYFLMGGALGYSLNQAQSTIYYAGDVRERESEEVTGEYRRFNYAFQTGMGWEHHFTERLTLVVQPTFRFWLKSLQQDVTPDRNLYQLGVQIGLRFDRPRAQG